MSQPMSQSNSQSKPATGVSAAFLSKERMIELAQGQLEAYNARDLAKFETFYHSDVQAYRLSDGEILMTGLAELRQMYGRRFSENPDLHCELKSRVVLQDAVLDEEWVTGLTNQEKPSHVVAIYRFKDDLIHRIWFVR